MSPSSKKQPNPPAERPVLFGFAFQHKGADGKIRVGFRWGRIATVFVSLFLLGWFGLSAGLYLHFKYNKDYSEASFSKMLVLLPSIPFGGLESHRVEMGNFQISKAEEALRARDFRDAFRLLRLGVARSPGNLKGRRMLAEFYETAIQRPDIAAKQLVEGLDQGGIQDIDYIKQTLQVLLRHQMDDKVQEIANQHLPEEPEPTDLNRALAFGAANANYLRGNYDLADDYLIDYALVDSLEGLLLSSQISWDRGDRVAAISKLESSLRKFPNSEPLLMQLSRYHRELEQYDQARRYAILRNVSDPLSAAPRIELLFIYHQTGDVERERQETRRMLRQFGDDQPALLSLTNFAADTGNVNLARRTYEKALENEFSIDSFALLLVEAHLVSDDYSGALEFAEELLRERPDWLTERWAIFNSLRSVASYGANRPDLGEIYLQDFLKDAKNNQTTYLAVARRFNDIDRTSQARRVLLAAYERFPNNQKILSDLIRAELELGATENLNRLLGKLLQMRRPQTDLLLDAYQKLGSDRFIFTPDRESLLLELSAILREDTRSEPFLTGASGG